MNNALTTTKKLAPFIAAVDALAVAEEAYLDGRIKHREYQAAVDAVIRERDAVGLQGMRIERRV